ncbi:MAG: protein kinase domain-containing protein, partial [Deltaproteobacteria bacterium]
MGLSTGTKLGPYEIVSPLGAGGMGEVYRARDIKLNRDVALKVLPGSLSHDAERLARFKREAQVLASLNHPNIATIYGFEEADGVRALAMELVEGQTLAEIIAARQGVPIHDALPLAKQIAEALEYAHERGIIHRDLKPANVKVTPEGTVKALDFGLAKALDVDPSSSSSNVSNSPTLTIAATQAGVIIGTAAYMSPEQARGKGADRKADIWSFGCVLYEMLAAKRLFEGETVSDTLAAVLTREPDWEKLPAGTPPHIRELLRRCLTKERKQRLQAIGEARIAIEETISGTVAPLYEPPSGEKDDAGHKPVLQRAMPWIAGIIIGALAAGILIWNLGTQSAPSATAIISQIQPSSDSSLDILMAVTSPPQLSPDGKSIVYAGKGPGGKKILHVRSLDSLSARPLNGTESATFPFWSPDGQFIGFFADGKLKKVDTSGGPPVDLCAASLGHGGSWASDGTIIFVPSGASPIYRVSADGGQPAQLTSLNSSRKEAQESSPQFLPDGHHFLFFSESASEEFSGIYVGSLDGGDPKPILRGISIATYAAPGYLLYLQDGALTARKFNPDKLEISGDPLVVQRSPNGEQIVTLSASPNGTLAYVAGALNADMHMAWYDRSGKKENDLGGPGEYYTPRLSPDDKKVAVAVATPTAPTRDLCIFDVERRTESRLTFDQLHNWSPVWSPDGTQIAYASNPKGNFHIYVRPGDGTGTVRSLLEVDAIE